MEKMTKTLFPTQFVMQYANWRPKCHQSATSLNLLNMWLKVCSKNCLLRKRNLCSIWDFKLLKITAFWSIRYWWVRNIFFVFMCWDRNSNSWPIQILKGTKSQEIICCQMVRTEYQNKLRVKFELVDIIIDPVKYFKMKI